MSQNALTYVYFDPSKIPIFPPWEKMRTFILIWALINGKYSPLEYLGATHPSF